MDRQQLQKAIIHFTNGNVRQSELTEVKILAKSKTVSSFVSNQRSMSVKFNRKKCLSIYSQPSLKCRAQSQTKFNAYLNQKNNKRQHRLKGKKTNQQSLQKHLNRQFVRKDGTIMKISDNYYHTRAYLDQWNNSYRQKFKNHNANSNLKNINQPQQFEVSKGFVINRDEIHTQGHQNQRKPNFHRNQTFKYTEERDIQNPSHKRERIDVSVGRQVKNHQRERINVSVGKQIRNHQRERMNVSVGRQLKNLETLSQYNSIILQKTPDIQSKDKLDTSNTFNPLSHINSQKLQQIIRENSSMFVSTYRQSFTQYQDPVFQRAIKNKIVFIPVKRPIIHFTYTNSDPSTANQDHLKKIKKENPQKVSSIWTQVSKALHRVPISQEQCTINPQQQNQLKKSRQFYNKDMIVTFGKSKIQKMNDYRYSSADRK